MATIKLVSVLSILGVFVSSLLGCSQAATPSQQQIEDINWKLESYGQQANPQRILEGSEVAANFRSSDHQVVGFGGCNGYGGGYELNGARLTVSALISTKIYCTEPEGVTEQETQYLDLLQNAESFQVQGGKLYINSGNQVLVFIR